LCVWVFQDRVLRTNCLGWLQTAVLLISASSVARVTGVSRWCLIVLLFLKKFFVGTNETEGALETSIMTSLWPYRVKRRKSRLGQNKDGVRIRAQPIRMLQE
jgi:hypothetical protein